MKKILISGLVVAGCLIGGCSSSGPDLREGKWQTTVKVDMAGMPFNTPPMIYEECLSQEDIVPRHDQQDENCQLDGPNVSGNTVSWKTTCTTEDGGMAISIGSITYAGEEFSGTMSVEVTGGMSMKAENTLTGKYLGACDN